MLRDWTTCLTSTTFLKGESLEWYNKTLRGEVASGYRPGSLSCNEAADTMTLCRDSDAVGSIVLLSLSFDLQAQSWKPPV